MTSQRDYYDISAGAGYLCGSLPLFILGGMLLANTNEDPTIFGTAALVCLALAVYLLLVGAIARGLQVARRQEQQAAADGRRSARR